VHRIWRAFGLQPHRQKHFKLSTDPFFVEKVRDIVGLYLNPPEKAMVFVVRRRKESGSGPGLIFKVPQLIMAQKIRSIGQYAENKTYLRLVILAIS
jgi:hypothetical protein